MKNKLILFFLLCLGGMQILGHMTENAPLRKLGLFTLASPAPSSFTSYKGLETFSSRFIIEWENLEGEIKQMPLTPKVWSKIEGPISRKSIYSSILSCTPIFFKEKGTTPAIKAMLAYSLEGDAPFLKELGIDKTQVKNSILLKTVPRQPEIFKKNQTLEKDQILLECKVGGKC